MKLKDIFENIDYRGKEHYYEIIRDYTHENFRDGVDDAADDLIKSNIAVYTGDMYRILLFPNKKFLKFRSIQAITAELHGYTQMLQRGNHEEKYYSWSKTANAAVVSIGTNISSELYGAVDDNKPIAGIMLSQTGKALDIEQFLGKGRVVNPEEEELLAEYMNNLHVVGFIVDYRQNTKFFPVGQYLEFIRYLKTFGDSEKQNNNTPLV